MSLVAAASLRTDTHPVRDDQVLAEVDDVIVRVLFEDIVRHLTTPVAVRDPQPSDRAETPDAPGLRSRAWVPAARIHPGRARSPPR